MVAKQLDKTVTQVALAWLVQHSPNISLIPRATSLAHLEENLAVAEIELPAEAMTALDAIG